MPSCNLYKVALLSDRVEGPNVLVFYAYHMSEAKAKAAAIRWGQAQHPGANISVDRIDKAT
jgi:hypothetical protein